MTEKELKKEYRMKNKTVFIAQIFLGTAEVTAAIFTVFTLSVIGVFVTGVIFVINLTLYIIDELKRSAYLADNIYRLDNKTNTDK